MKNFDLNAYGVSEMNQQEMLMIDGGNIFKDAWNAVCNAVDAVADAVADACVWLWDNVLSHSPSMSI